MKNKKKLLLSVIGMLILLLTLFGVTYAFFSYMYTGEEENTVQLGTIMFAASEKTLELTNVFPTTLQEATDVATVSVQGYTTYENGIDFTIKATDVTAKVNNVIPTVVVTREEVDGITYTDGKDLVTTYDKNNRITNDTILCTGKIDVNKTVGSADNFTKILTLSVYYDKDEYHISDSTKEALINSGMLPSDYKGEIIDTTTWNSLREDVTRNASSAYSFRIQILSVESSESLKEKIQLTLPLTEADVDGTRYVTGKNVNNNYVWYSGKLWRIVALNDDDTIKLVTQNSITTISWDITNNNDYSKSQVRSWLNNDFLSTINSNLIVDSEWDYTIYSTTPTIKITDGVVTVPDKVGLLTVYDYVMTGGTNKQATSASYLNNNYSWWTMTATGKTSSFTGNKTIYLISDLNYAQTTEGFSSYGIRPSVVLKADLTLLGNGTGELNNPYMFEEDTNVGLSNELLSSRISGEYVKFNNVKYRIVGVENGLTKITMADYTKNKNTLSLTVPYGASESELKFNPSYGIGKYLNDWYNTTSENDVNGTYSGLYIDETYKKMIVPQSDGVIWYLGPDEGANGDYKKAIEGNNVNATIGLLRYGEMFSSQFGVGASDSTSIWLITRYSTNKNNVINKRGYNGSNTFDKTYGVRPAFYLKSDVKIAGGTGMPHDAYTIYQ